MFEENFPAPPPPKRRGLKLQKLVLTHHEMDSFLWKKIRGHLQAELDILRKINDNEISYDKTCNLRGHIERIKLILAAVVEEPAGGLPRNHTES